MLGGELNGRKNSFSSEEVRPRRKYRGGQIEEIVENELSRLDGAPAGALQECSALFFIHGHIVPIDTLRQRRIDKFDVVDPGQ